MSPSDELSSPSAVSLSSVPLPVEAGRGPRAIYILQNLLSAKECKDIIKSHTNLIPANVTPETIRDRQVFQDEELAKRVWRRIQPFFLASEEEEKRRIEDKGRKRSNVEGIEGNVEDKDRDVWKVSGLNEHWRLARYGIGGKFSPHTDGRRLASINSQAFYTINVYLNTVADGCGGATRFFSSNKEVVAQVKPTLGTAVLFRDDIWHDGEVLMWPSGYPHSSQPVKYLLRTDIMFDRVDPIPLSSFLSPTNGSGVESFEEWCVRKGWGEDREKMGRKALAVAEGLEDAGVDGMEVVRWYKKAWRLWPGLEFEGRGEGV
ncbi:hypothetical protein ONS95_000677 [Cadophora gregata]|uniref:uncharacterized protein n=1 Tax=Cadophora gregata TaxID=51156 RepID=UPI0026DC0571|nr:uncharacterized protein ONS95_000677 [Cadophora gregata]KAK0125293.1 hypothetical protein ONS96_009148 [Cadophora gregata f. sp. sojae]KAK0128723.1 hypothetical protein ONS95_000677 [Cadophora gregata]